MKVTKIFLNWIKTDLTDSSFDFDDLNCSKRRQQFRNDLIIYYSCEGLGAPNNLLSLMWY